MSRILVVDDDPDIRGLLAAYLKADGHSVEFAEDGVAGAASAVRFVPDLVVADFQMPRMDGFALFNALRSTPATAKVPVIMLTAHNSPTLMIKALGMGLDDVVGKPVTREDLNKVVSHLLKPVERWRPAPAKTTKSLVSARAEFFGTVVCCEIYRLEAFMMKLKKPELAELVDQFANEVRQVVQDDHGWVLKPDFHHIVIAFPEDTGAGDHALRALRGALKTVLAAQKLKPWIARRFAGRDLPEVVVAVGVHTGKIQPRPARAGRELGLKGEGAETAALLAESIQTLHWSVAASQATAKAAGFAFLAGRTAQVQTPEGGELAAIEVKGFAPPQVRAAPAAPEKAATLVEAAVDRNAALVTKVAAIPRPVAAPSPAAKPPVAARPAAPPPVPKPAPAATPKPAPKPTPKFAPKPAVTLATPMPKPKPAASQASLPPPVDPFAARTVVLRLADTGIGAVHLTLPKGGGAQEVLKTFLVNDDRKQTKRRILVAFLDQYATFRAIEHPNLARTFDHGLSETHLFVTQEYCSGGDLRNLIAQGMSADDAVKALLRIASGLKAAHQKGFVHGDLRPANVMLREDGSFALVDAALASVVEYAVAEGESGVLLRSPDYLSPEMINGQPADMRSDIYALGLLLHEMLTGKRAYASPDLSRVMMDQLNAPVPALPEQHARFQPLLNKLMAKSPEQRFASVADVIAFMMEAKLQS
jgi:serine/threonine-protein kinase PpkA